MQEFFWDVFKQLFGVDATFANVLVFFIMYFAGAGFIFWMDVRARDKESERTPTKFSFWFMLNDNRGRIFTQILLAFIFVMAGSNVLTYIQYATGSTIVIPEPLGRTSPIILGLSSDWMAMKIKNKFGWKKER